VQLDEINLHSYSAGSESEDVAWHVQGQVWARCFCAAANDHLTCFLLPWNARHLQLILNGTIVATCCHTVKTFLSKGKMCAYPVSFRFPGVLQHQRNFRGTKKERWDLELKVCMPPCPMYATLPHVCTSHLMCDTRCGSCARKLRWVSTQASWDQ
jgi:hypothetical protein